MGYINLTIIGNVGREPNLHFTNDGTAICDFSLAANVRKDKTVWFQVTCWRELADLVAEYVHKGSQVAVYADDVQAEPFMGKDNKPRATIRVTARQVRFLDKAGEGEADRETEKTEPF